MRAPKGDTKLSPWRVFKSLMLTSGVAGTKNEFYDNYRRQNYILIHSEASRILLSCYISSCQTAYISSIPIPDNPTIDSCTVQETRTKNIIICILDRKATCRLHRKTENACKKNSFWKAGVHSMMPLQYCHWPDSPWNRVLLYHPMKTICCLSFQGLTVLYSSAWEYSLLGFFCPCWMRNW